MTLTKAKELLALCDHLADRESPRSVRRYCRAVLALGQLATDLGLVKEPPATGWRMATKDARGMLNDDGLSELQVYLWHRYQIAPPLLAEARPVRRRLREGL